MTVEMSHEPEPVFELGESLQVIRISAPESPDVAYVRQHQPEVFGLVMSYDRSIGGTFIDYWATSEGAIAEGQRLILAEMEQPSLKPVWRVSVLYTY